MLLKLGVGNYFPTLLAYLAVKSNKEHFGDCIFISVFKILRTAASLTTAHIQDLENVCFYHSSFVLNSVFVSLLTTIPMCSISKCNQNMKWPVCLLNTSVLLDLPWCIVWGKFQLFLHDSLHLHRWYRKCCITICPYSPWRIPTRSH